jgi:hypothetical protein
MGCSAVWFIESHFVVRPGNSADFEVNGSNLFFIYFYLFIYYLVCAYSIRPCNFDSLLSFTII